MEFRTEYKPSKSILTINPTLPVVLAGSCFSHNMGKCMRRHLWNAVNVTGTLFNPFSVGRAIELMILDKKDRESAFRETLFQKEGIICSWLFDSSFGAREEIEVINAFNRRAEIFCSSLENGKTLILTFGSSICYFQHGENMPVGNCHKQPSGLFSRRRLTIIEIVEYWEGLLSKLNERFGKLNFIFTVSPVRHLKDGFEGNLRSKSILLLAIEEICSSHESCHYFPSYEIVTDDLRDYRFYASDMVHPSDQAVEYLWEKFIATYIDQSGISFLKEGERIVKGLMHKVKPDASGSVSSIRRKDDELRLMKLHSEYNSLKSKYPQILRQDYPFDTDPGF